MSNCSVTCQICEDHINGEHTWDKEVVTDNSDIRVLYFSDQEKFSRYCHSIHAWSVKWYGQGWYVTEKGESDYNDELIFSVYTVDKYIEVIKENVKIEEKSIADKVSMIKLLSALS